MSIKSVLGVAVILGLTCAQVQAGPKPWGDRTSGRDLDAFRYDVREAAKLRREPDLPRLSETAAEYNARISGTPVTKWQYERRQETTVTVGPTKDAKARTERRRQSACDRLSQRAAHNWSRAANEMYNDYCLD